ncbi:MAG: hypothetical protein PHV60_08820, partial [bacterium]|nr:hypothetical protein [bacterium]
MINQRLVVKTVFFLVILAYGSLIYYIAAHKVPKTSPIEEWQKFELAVRDGQIDKTAARKVLPVIMAQVETQARRYSFAYGQNWIFPVQGSGVNDIAGN